MAIVLFALMVQNFIDTKFAKVSFSYQLEHLVNLQLLQPEDSHKIALNDNLVTFSGKFRDRLTEEGKTRFKYLELLYSNHELKSDQARVKSDLKNIKSKIYDSSTLFLQLSGIPLSKGGFVIVDDTYNTPDEDNSIVLKTLPESNIESLKNLRSEFATVQQNLSNAALKNLGNGISELLRNFRSPSLGIGSENVKQTLKNIDKEVSEAAQLASTQRLSLYGKALETLQTIVDDINQEEDHIRLGKLRSVRNYKETLEEYNQITYSP